MLEAACTTLESYDRINFFNRKSRKSANTYRILRLCHLLLCCCCCGGFAHFIAQQNEKKRKKTNQRASNILYFGQTIRTQRLFRNALNVNQHFTKCIRGFFFLSWQDDGKFGGDQRKTKIKITSTFSRKLQLVLSLLLHLFFSSCANKGKDIFKQDSIEILWSPKMRILHSLSKLLNVRRLPFWPFTASKNSNFANDPVKSKWKWNRKRDSKAAM